MSDVYKKCKEHEQAVINFSGYDISTNHVRSFTAANPIIVALPGLDNEVFTGAIVWESTNITKIFNEMIVPKSFINGKYPFIQIRMPEYPVKEELIVDDKIVYKVIN